MRRRVFIGTVGGLAASLAFPATGQGLRPLPHVSFLSHSSPEEWGSRLAEFRAELRALGYAEGRDVIVEVWWAENRLERLPALIAEILNSKPAVIVTHGSPNVAALQKATSTVPIVFAAAADPVGQGFIKSYRRPGGNITGIMFANTDIMVLELVKIVMPGVSRIGVMLNPDLPASNSWIDILPSSGKALGLQSRVVKATSREGVGPAFIEVLKAKVQALIVAPMAPFVGLHALLVELQFKHRLPTFYAVGEAADAGGLASYSFPQGESYRRAAALVDHILKGRSPADIPVEIPTKYEIAINLKTAKALGIKVPESALLRAHKVIGA